MSKYKFVLAEKARPEEPIERVVTLERDNDHDLVTMKVDGRRVCSILDTGWLRIYPFMEGVAGIVTEKNNTYIKVEKF